MRLMHSSLTERTKRSAYAFRFGDRGGDRITSMPSRPGIARKDSQYWCRGRDKKASTAQEWLLSICQVTGNLYHPCFVRVRCHSCNLYGASCQIQGKQHVMRHQSAQSKTPTEKKSVAAIHSMAATFISTQVGTSD